MGSNSNVLAFGQNKATVVAEGDIKDEICGCRWSR